MDTPGDVQFTFKLSPGSGHRMIINSSSINGLSGSLNASGLFDVAFWTWKPRLGMFEEGVELRTLLQEAIVVECTLGIPLYNYSNISSISYDFKIGASEKILIGINAGETDEVILNVHSSLLGYHVMWWNGKGQYLPDTYLSSLDLYHVTNFFHSPAFSGILDNQEWFESFSPGATTAFGDGSLEAVSGVFDSITLSLTDMIRQGNGMQIAQGKTSQTIVYIRVRWRWLILPLAVHFLGGMTLLETIVEENETKDVPLWKCSTLAVLYHSVNKDRVQIAQVKDLEELKKVETIQVMLEKKGGMSDSWC